MFSELPGKPDLGLRIQSVNSLLIVSGADAPPYKRGRADSSHVPRPANSCKEPESIWYPPSRPQIREKELGTLTMFSAHGSHGGTLIRTLSAAYTAGRPEYAAYRHTSMLANLERLVGGRSTRHR